MFRSLSIIARTVLCGCCLFAQYHRAFRSPSPLPSVSWQPAAISRRQVDVSPPAAWSSSSRSAAVKEKKGDMLGTCYFCFLDLSGIAVGSRDEARLLTYCSRHL